MIPSTPTYKKLTKEEVALLPIVSFPGEIIVIDTIIELRKAVRYLNRQLQIGFDTETRPSFTKGRSYSVSLLQLSTNKRCYLFRLNKIGLPPQLKNILESSKIQKIGLSTHDDFGMLRKIGPIKPSNFIEIQSIIRNYQIDELGLQKIFALLFGQKISKSQRLSNWETEELSESQQRYAATDAWATLLIYQKLLEIKQ